MTDPILVGTDGSDGARRAVEWAADEAALRQRPLHIVHCIDSSLYGAPLFAPREAVESLTEAGRRLLADAGRIARTRRPAVPVTTGLITGFMTAALRERSPNAYELVLGHRGLGGFASLLLGSTGLSMAAHAACPVVIVRGDTAPERGEIVVGVPLGGQFDETLRYAFEAAAARAARVRVLHAWRPPVAYAEAGHDLDERQLEEKIRWELIEAHAPWRKIHPSVDVTEEVVREHPVTALCDASQNADLVVVGAHHHGRFGDLGLGSVSHGTVHHAHCPVVITRHR